MSLRRLITPRFVQFVPEILEEGILYVSIEYATVAHRCCCGCGQEVVTPLSPTDWTITFNGESVSLYPSIGNWSFGCRSHYWIENNRVSAAGEWSDEEVDAGRKWDKLQKARYFQGRAEAEEKDGGEKNYESLDVDRNAPKW